MMVGRKDCGKQHEAYSVTNVQKYTCTQEAKVEVVTAEERRGS